MDKMEYEIPTLAVISMARTADVICQSDPGDNEVDGSTLWGSN